MNKAMTVAYCLSQNNFCRGYVLPGTPVYQEFYNRCEIMVSRMYDMPNYTTPGVSQF